MGRKKNKQKRVSKLPKIGRRVVKNDAEFQCYKALRGIVPRGADIGYETEKLPYVIEHEYVPDFPIELRDGRKIYIEYKGNGRSFDATVRRKLIAVKDQHPDIDLRLVFHTDGKIGPVRKDGSYLKQSDWAKKHGFTFAIRTPPKEWFTNEV